MQVTEDRGRRCIFCRKHEDDVHLLIGSPDAYICDFCILRCSEVAVEFFRTKSRTIEDQAEELRKMITRPSATRKQIESGDEQPDT